MGGLASPHTILGASCSRDSAGAVHSSSCGAHRGVFHSPFFFYYRCHCNWCDLVLFVGRLLAQRPLGAARVFASRCRVVVVLLPVVPTILFGTVFCCHCYCRDLELSSASVLRECLRRDVVWWWKFHSCRCLRFRLGQREAYDWKLRYLFPVPRGRWVCFAC